MQKQTRRFRDEDFPPLLEKIFNEFDSDKNHRFTKGEFPRVVKTLINLIGGEEPAVDDV